MLAIEILLIFFQEFPKVILLCIAYYSKIIEIQLGLFFSHNCKNCCNFFMRSLITLKFGTKKGTEFGMNLNSIQCVRRLIHVEND